MNKDAMYDIKSVEEGYKELAFQIIKLALEDYKNQPRMRPHLKRYFFNSEYFIFLCDCINLNPYMILNKLKSLEARNKEKRRKTR